MTAPRDELRSPELLSSWRGRAWAAAFVVLALAVVLIAALRPDRQGVGTPVGGALPSAAPSPSPSPSPSPTPSSAPSPSPRLSPVPAPTPPPLTAKTGSRLLVVQGTRLEVLDVDSGRREVLTTSRDLGTSYDRLDVVATGGRLVLVGDNNTGAGSGPFDAYVTRPVPGSSFRVVGQASYLRPSDHAGRVWLVADKDTNDADSGETLVEVDVRGVVHQRAHFSHRFGVLPFAGGFLVDADVTAPGDAGEQGTDLVDARGRLRHHYPSPVLLVDGDTALLADNNEPCARACRLQVLTAGSRVVERTVLVDALSQPLEAALSPDHSRLFTGVIVEGSDKPPTRVSELDLRTGHVHELADAWGETFYAPSFVFSPDSRWMFFADADGVHVNAYDLSARRSFRVQGDFGTITQLELLAG